MSRGSLAPTLLIVNPASGKGRAPVLAKLIAALLDGPVRTHTVRTGDPPELIRQAASGARRVAVFGGDGTVRSAVSAASEERIPLAIVPCGTGNALARALGLSVRRTYDLLATDAAPRSLDLLDTSCGRACFCAGAGFDAAVVGALTRAAAGWWGKLAYVPAICRARRASAAVGNVSLSVDGVLCASGPAWQCFVTTVADLGGCIRVAPEAHPGDGLLHVSLFRPPVPGVPEMLWWIVSSFLVGRSVPVDVRCSGCVATLESSDVFPVELDGDVVGNTSHLTVRVLPGALRVYY